MEAHHHVNGPDTGSNSGGRRTKKLASLNLNGTNQGESHIYPPSCTKPRQPTIYLQALLYLYEVMNVKNV